MRPEMGNQNMQEVNCKADAVKIASVWQITVYYF